MENLILVAGQNVKAIHLGLVLLALAVYVIKDLPLQSPFGNILIVIVSLISIISIAKWVGIF